MAAVALVGAWLASIVAILVAFFTVVPWAAEQHLLHPSEGRVVEVTGVSIPEDREDYDAWTDDYWLDGGYWVTFSIDRDELETLRSDSGLVEMKQVSEADAEARLAEMEEDWADDGVTRALATPMSLTGEEQREVVIDLSDPDEAVIYAYGYTL